MDICTFTLCQPMGQWESRVWLSPQGVAGESRCPILLSQSVREVCSIPYTGDTAGRPVKSAVCPAVSQIQLGGQWCGELGSWDGGGCTVGGWRMEIRGHWSRTEPGKYVRPPSDCVVGYTVIDILSNVAKTALSTELRMQQKMQDDLRLALIQFLLNIF